jgi:GMP synthase-like glutamine amidotransferase
LRILVIDNYPDCPIGLVGQALDEVGAIIDRRHPYKGEALPFDASGHDGLIILGGPQNALADDEHLYLKPLCDLSLDFTRADKAVLGICLGSQLLARAHGGDNIIGRPIEFGWQDVTPLEAGKADPMMAELGVAAPMFHWHNDTVTVPPTATHLASSAMTPVQAWRVGRATYGVQFHFEASTNVVEGWSNSHFAPAMATYHPGWENERHTLAETLGTKADAVGIALARKWVGLV